MRILQSIALEGRSAGSEWAIEYSRILKARGHRVFFLTVPNSQTFVKAQAAGLEMVEAIDLSERNLVFLKNLFKLGKVLKELKPDVVMAHWGPDHLAWGWALRKTKIPLVRVRSHSPLAPNRHFVSIWLHRRTALFVVGNQMQARQYVEGLEISPEKVVTVHFGMDLTKYPLDDNPSAAPGNWALRLLQLGRFSQVKGHRFLIEALGKLKPELVPFRLTIAGYEAEVRAVDMKKWREEAGLWDQVEIFANLPDVKPLIAACDLGVVASIGSEATARVALEFMAAGKPVVASKVGILPELVDENTGWLFEPGNAESFGAVIKKALVSRERHPLMGRKARQKVESEYDLQKLAGKLESALQKVVTNA